MNFRVPASPARVEEATRQTALALLVDKRRGGSGVRDFKVGSIIKRVVIPPRSPPGRHRGFPQEAINDFGF